MPRPDEAPAVLFLCTGNAARSVMAAAFLRRLTPDIAVTSAGTHALPGMPPGRDVRTVLREHHVGSYSHRSASLEEANLAGVDVVVALATEHVRFVRAHHAAHAAKTATLRRLCRDLPPGGEPLPVRVERLALDGVTLEDWEDVDDPAGRDVGEYRVCGKDIAALTEQLGPRLLGRATLF